MELVSRVAVPACLQRRAAALAFLLHYILFKIAHLEAFSGSP